MSKQRIPHTQYEKLYRDQHQLVAGVDEAGRGALAGPVVAAAVILRADCDSLPGVRDSKQVGEAEREKLYHVVCEEVLCWGVGVVEADQIDEMNILQATYLAMREAVRACSVQPHHLLIDGNRFSESRIPYTTIVEGDAISLSIAAASIIAKVTRDRIMIDVADLYPAYGFVRHKGYGTVAHRDAIVKNGASEVHRRSFLRKLEQQKLQLLLLPNE